ncbi:MAG: peptidoglycan DD-metalloendopeptidase family protein [Clostridia bacterium]|nr:peptidoglycan DD-metalloendopeptidase family protein [Clostridia bacterium]
MKKTWKIILCTLLSVLTLTAVAMPAVFAAKTSATEFADNSQVKEFQAAIAALEKEQEALKNKLKNLQNQRYTEQQKANDLKNLILSTEKKIETTQSLLAALSAQIAEKEVQIAEKEAQIEAKSLEVSSTRERFLLLVRTQYEGEPINILSVILGADGIADMLSRIEYMASILDYNSKLLAKFKAEKQELEDMKRVLESSRSDLQADYESQVAYNDTLEKEKADLELQKGKQDDYVAALRMSEAEIQKEYEAARKAEEEENARLEKLLKQLAEESKKAYVGGKFIWPVDTSIKRISSDYGWRTYYYKGKKVTDFHMGIDIPAAVGTNIYAVQSGEVILAANHYSYGNYMIVDHGGGITTLYAHCSKLLKKVGDKVTQGDHIAEMGSTGQSTGSHLHIEVRVNGKHQDPIANGWLVQPQ